MPRELTPIPTLYRGRRFRSRFEAEVAYILDALGIRWVYETTSFLLPNGVHYRPDFYVRAGGVWIEARGYASQQGRSQIVGFTKMIREGRIPGGYAVVAADGCMFTTREEGTTALSLARCVCGAWRLRGEFEPCCLQCARSGRPSRGVVLDVQVCGGHLHLSDGITRFSLWELDRARLARSA